MRKIYFTIFTLLILAASTKAQECGVVYVSPTGASSGVTGTKVNPASLTHGLNLVSPVNNKVYLATGLYNISNALSIPSDVTVEGGFDATSWTKSNTAESIIHRDNNNVNLLGNALVALHAQVASNFRLQDLTVEVEDAPTPQGSTYGIYLYVCNNYNIVRCKVIAGAGGDGAAVNTPGEDGAVGADGLSGGLGAGDGGAFGSGGNGGAGAGTTGGTAGSGGSFGSAPGQTGGTPSTVRGGGGGGGGAAGGIGSSNGGVGGNGGGFSGSNTAGGGSGQYQGSSACNSISNCSNSLSGAPGGNGANGANGAAGGAPNPGLHFNGFFNPGTGGQGGDGTGGQGGAGGGGGGGEDGLLCDAGSGSGGGGGGGGGEGGEGGPGGQGGGSSFCIYTVGNGVNGFITDCRLQPGAPGTGGAGGPGGQGGAGGAGGAGGSFDDGDIGCGGNGGNGGAGGNGGTGGQGPDGESRGVQHDGVPATVSGTTIPGNPPIITVDNPGCINATVTFTGSTAGTWDFGTGAVPQTATGTGPHAVRYSTPGRRTINYDGATFRDYINIYNNLPGLNLPSITASGTINQGCPVTFNTTLALTNYAWDFGADATPQTQSGATLGTTGNVVFNTPGTHTIYLTIPTSCCGNFLDSLVINVNPQSLSLTPDPSASVCEGQTVTFNATAGFSTYIFLNGNSGVQSGASNTYSNPNLASGSNMSVAAVAQGCTLISNVVVYTVYPTPTVDLGADSTICGQATTTLDAGSFASYLWSPGGETTQTITVGTGTYSVAVTDSNGCTASDDITLTVSGALTAVVTPPGPISLCAGNTAVLDAGSGYASYLWSPGGQTTQTLTVSSAGNYSVYVTDNNGCDGTSNTVAVSFGNSVTPTILVNGNNICVVDTFATYQWVYDGTDIAGATDNCYDITESGIFTVRVTTNAGCSGTAGAVELSYIGVEEQNFANHISVYPNPTENSIVLELEFNRPENLLIRLHDVLGRELNAPMQLESVRSLRKEISLSEFAEGFYFLVLEKNDVRLVKKVLKK